MRLSSATDQISKIQPSFARNHRSPEERRQSPEVVAADLTPAPRQQPSLPKEKRPFAGSDDSVGVSRRSQTNDTETEAPMRTRPMNAPDPPCSARLRFAAAPRKDPAAPRTRPRHSAPPSHSTLADAFAPLRSSDSSTHRGDPPPEPITPTPVPEGPRAGATSRAPDRRLSLRDIPGSLPEDTPREHDHFSRTSGPRTQIHPSPSPRRPTRTTLCHEPSR